MKIYNYMWLFTCIIVVFNTSAQNSTEILYDLDGRLYYQGFDFLDYAPEKKLNVYIYAKGTESGIIYKNGNSFTSKLKFTESIAFDKYQDVDGKYKNLVPGNVDAVVLGEDSLFKSGPWYNSSSSNATHEFASILFEFDGYCVAKQGSYILVRKDNDLWRTGKIQDDNLLANNGYSTKKHVFNYFGYGVEKADNEYKTSKYYLFNPVRNALESEFENRNNLKVIDFLKLMCFVHYYQTQKYVYLNHLFIPVKDKKSAQYKAKVSEFDSLTYTLSFYEGELKTASATFKILDPSEFDGNIQYYYPNNRIRKLHVYKDGNIEIIKTFYPSGNPHFIINSSQGLSIDQNIYQTIYDMEGKELSLTDAIKSYEYFEPNDSIKNNFVFKEGKLSSITKIFPQRFCFGWVGDNFPIKYNRFYKEFDKFEELNNPEFYIKDLRTPRLSFVLVHVDVNPNGEIIDWKIINNPESGIKKYISLFFEKHIDNNPKFKLARYTKGNFSFILPLQVFVSMPSENSSYYQNFWMHDMIFHQMDNITIPKPPGW